MEESTVRQLCATDLHPHLTGVLSLNGGLNSLEGWIDNKQGGWDPKSSGPFKGTSGERRWRGTF